MIKIIRNIAHSPNSLRGAAGLLIVTLFLSNILGVVRNYFLTRYLPIQSLDIYYAAFRLPDLVFNLLILGAIASAFIPVFTGYLANKDEDSAWHIANSVLTLAISTLAIALIALYFLMPLIIHLVVPNFTDIEQRETIRIARIFLLSPLFFGVSYVLGGILNSSQRFFAYSIAPLVYNLSIISAAALLAPLFPRGDSRQLTVVAVGVVFGAFLHMLIQVPSVRHMGMRFRWIFDYRHQAVRRIGKLMIPRTIGLGANQLMLVVFTALASAIPGAVSYFNLANDIQTMPTVVFGTSFATAIFPALSAAASRQDDINFSNYLTRTVNIIIALLIPFTVGIILLRVGIVQMLLGFNLSHVINTANTLAMFSLSLIASGLIPLFSRAFYAKQDTRTPMIASVIAIIISIAVALLSPIISDTLISLGIARGAILRGAPGLAFGFSVGVFFNAVYLYLVLRRRYSIFNLRSILRLSFKVIFASIVMGLVIYFMSHLFTNWFDVQNSRIGVFSQVIVSSLFGIIAYLGLSRTLGIKEVRALWRRDVKE